MGGWGTRQLTYGFLVQTVTPCILNDFVDNAALLLFSLAIQAVQDCLHSAVSGNDVNTRSIRCVSEEKLTLDSAATIGQNLLYS